MRLQTQASWVSSRLSIVPPAWVGRVEAIHAEKAAESWRPANLWLLDITDRMAGLRVPINASDAEIIDLSHKCARACMNLAGIAPQTMEGARGRMARFCERYGVTPPEPARTTKHGNRVGVDDEPAVKRMTDPLWWRGRLRKAQARGLEREAIALGYVHRRGEIYASDATVERRGQQRRRNAAVLEGTEAVNLETGEIFTLAELAERAVSNPAIRRGELMTRIAGFEAIAKGLGHAAMFVTLTCPSRFHPKKLAGDAKVPVDNHRFDGSTPRDAQGWLVKTWARIRAALHRLAVRPYGFRIAEPHHDATPHWHMLLFVARDAVKQLCSTIREHMLRDEGDEPGAAKHRVTFQAIDPAKGSAAGYVAKYISKNIDAYQMQGALDFEGEDLPAVTSAPRVEAWASTWGIRQFQQIGGPPVGVWRELRRIRDEDAEHGPEMTRARAAADAGNWGSYVEVMGGPTVARDALPLVVAYSRPGEKIVAGEQEGRPGIMKNSPKTAYSSELKSES